MRMFLFLKFFIFIRLKLLHAAVLARCGARYHDAEKIIIIINNDTIRRQRRDSKIIIERIIICIIIMATIRESYIIYITFLYSFYSVGWYNYYYILKMFNFIAFAVRFSNLFYVLWIHITVNLRRLLNSCWIIFNFNNITLCLLLKCF